MNEEQLAAKYVLYSHYSYEEDSDFKTFEQSHTTSELKGIAWLNDHLRGLAELLKTPGYEGVLVLFYAPGFLEFLAGVEKQKEKSQLRAESSKLRFAEAFVLHAREQLHQAELLDRVRILSSLDLYAILGSTHPNFAELFIKFITGSAPALRYDSPKIVEAILRLRLLGTGIPVFRIDQDVLFRHENADSESVTDLGVFKAIVCSIRAYQLRLSQPSVGSFLFSASYDFRELQGQSEDSFKAWSGAFATRVYPAVIADTARIDAIFEQTEDDPQSSWERYLLEHTDDTLALRFFGLKRKPTGVVADGLTGIARFGAPPLNAVTSGALLAISDGAILDLPPFSNFHHNVMWIDDHLKYSLHRAMNHFRSRQGVRSEPSLGSSRLTAVMVTKGRPKLTIPLPVYVFNVYLPALLWGTVMDSWITDDPILKQRLSEVEPGEQSRWENAWQKQSTGVLPQALLSAGLRSHFPPNDGKTLGEALTRRALRRINEVRMEWASLQNARGPTFVSLWAEGRVRESLGKWLPGPKADDLWEGIAPGLPIGEEVEEQHLTPTMLKKLGILVENTVEYVLWTQDWPKFIQILRSVPEGEFGGDLSWGRWATSVAPVRPEGNGQLLDLFPTSP